MKWIAFALLVVNIGVWYVAQGRPASMFSAQENGGALPRVETLKPPGAESASEPSLRSGSGMDGQSLNNTVDKPAGPGVSLVCVRLGWIESEPMAQALVESHRGESASRFQIEEVVQSKPPLNWVIIPPQPREVALRQFREIQRQGIDSYLVTRGENKNAISLGIFESRDAAITVLEEKKRQNLNAVLVKFTRNQISYALTFEARPESAKAMVGAIEADHGKKFDFVEINPCKGVATPEKNP